VVVDFEPHRLRRLDDAGVQLVVGRHRHVDRRHDRADVRIRAPFGGAPAAVGALFEIVLVVVVVVLVLVLNREP
jgi:hypothetical protein